MSDTITGALIGGTIALVGLIFAKEGKTSEFRQQWIDGLRADVAGFIALALHIGMRQTQNPALDDVRAANEYLARIQLRLNLNEGPSKRLIDSLHKLEANATARNPKLPPFAEVASENAQAVLKEEWNRVKRGEWKYKTALWTALLFLLVGLLNIVYHWIGH